MKKLLLLLSLYGVQASAQPQLKFTRYDVNVAGTGDSDPGYLCVAGNKLFFAAKTAASGTELWATDGTIAGTQMVRDIYAGTFNSYPNHTIAMAGKLYFDATDGSGRELWMSDGTAVGTRMVEDLTPGFPAIDVTASRMVLNGKLYFSAIDPATGTELWVTDGTTAGTQLVKDIRPGPSHSGPHYFELFNGLLYFVAGGGTNKNDVWMTDGTNSGTQLLKDLYPGGNAFAKLLTAAPGKLFFAANNAAGTELWISDGTAAGTQMVKDIHPSGIGFAGNEMAAFNNKVYFRGDDGTTGGELWVSDGTAGGTYMLKEIAPGTVSGYPGKFTEYKGKLYFTANDGVNGVELWVTDGTANGTQLVTDINGTGSSEPKCLTVFGGYLYFVATDSALDDQLFVSDGTAAGTKMVAPIAAPDDNALHFAEELVVFDSSLYFRADYDTTGAELWSIRDTSVVGIQEPGTATRLRIYPNPGDGNFTLELNGAHIDKAELTVHDMAGRIVYSEMVANNRHNFRLEHAAKGVYIVKLQAGPAVYTDLLQLE